jgi:H+/gluconate symporter-like permease
MGIVGCLLGFAVVIYFCFKDWSVYLATFFGACVVILFNWLPFVDALTNASTGYVSGIYIAIKGFFFMLVFGCVLSRLYTESGAAYAIADTIINLFLKENTSNTKKNCIAIAIVLSIGTILSIGGIIAGAIIVLMYPIALAVFERCDIPKRFILGLLGAGAYTFTLTFPGSPEVTNVAAMTALGTSASVALVPGLVGAAAEVIAIFVLMNAFINKGRNNGEHFEFHPLDPRYDSNRPKPKFVLAVLPMVFLFVLFNAFKLNINVCLILSCILSLAVFWPQLKSKNLKEILCSGAEQGVPMVMTVGSICGFAAVVTNTDAFQSVLNFLVGLPFPPIIICAVVIAIMSMLTGGSSTGQLIALPQIAPKLTALGLNVNIIHRVSCFAATTLDSMPYCGSILMLLPMSHMKLKEAYPPLFVTTVICTTIGTITVMIMCTLFPGLA